MSQCESRHNGKQCFYSHNHKGAHGTFGESWSDEQADKPMTQGDYQKEAAKRGDFDPILTKTGKTREWWRYHFAGLAMQKLISHTDARAGLLRQCAKDWKAAGEILLEELEK